MLPPLNPSDGGFRRGCKVYNLMGWQLDELVLVRVIQHFPKGFVEPVDVDANDGKLVKIQMPGARHFPQLLWW
jgi:hypothetical protein